jgi:hypothetical protein
VKEQRILFISASDRWVGPWKGRHQIMSRWLKDNEVVFVEEPRLSLLSIIRDRSRVKRLWSWLYVRRPNKNLTLYTPLLSIPFGSRFKTINIINNIILYFNIKILLYLIRYKPTILYLSYYTYNTFSKMYDDIIKIYNAHDVWEVYHPNKKMRNYHGGLEEDTIKSVDIAIFTSKNNMQKKYIHNKSCYYIPHGCPNPPEWIISGPNPARPPDMPKDTKPVIGYWGTIDTGSIDVDLIDNLSERRQDWNFVFIGPIHNYNRYRFNVLGRKPNIFFLGCKRELYRYTYLCHFDVGILCATMSEMETKGSQLKIWEYISAGIPIVSIPVEEYMNYKEYIYFAHNIYDWDNKISTALYENNICRKVKRIIFAYQNSWDKRVLMLNKLIDAYQYKIFRQ